MSSRSATGRRRQMRAAVKGKESSPMLPSPLPSPPPPFASPSSVLFQPTQSTQYQSLALSADLSWNKPVHTFEAKNSPSPRQYAYNPPSSAPAATSRYNYNYNASPRPYASSTSASPSSAAYFSHESSLSSVSEYSASSYSPSPISTPRLPTPVSLPSPSLRHSQSASSVPPSSFVYPTCRSNAHPSQPKPSRKNKFKPAKLTDAGSSTTDLSLSSLGSKQPRTGRFRAMLRRMKKAEKVPSLPTSPPISAMQDGDATSSASFTDSVANEPWVTLESENVSDKVVKTPSVTSPYMLPYDPPFLESDSQTNNLLRRLKIPGEPCFHAYGWHPPARVLDLGCGKGDWVMEAAASWGTQGTQITGFDLVDLSGGNVPQTEDGRVLSNVVFMRGNFLEPRLPFPDRTFDLVRLANVALCVPSTDWRSLLLEVRRIMTIGGRLELIDDEIMFPYANPVHTNQDAAHETPPKLDILIPSPSLSSMSVSEDSSKIYPQGLRKDVAARPKTPRPRKDSTVLPPFGVETYSAPFSRRTMTPSPSWCAWDVQATMSSSLESIFENMLAEKFLIHPRPSEFILDVLKDVFGGRHSSIMRTMHIELAPVEPGPSRLLSPSSSNFPGITSPDDYAMVAAAAAVRTSRGKTRSDSLSKCPGIILWPGTFIPVPQLEVEMYALKHVWTLLGCKNALADYVEVRDDGVRVIDEEFWDALHDYKSFTRERFEGLDCVQEEQPAITQRHNRHESTDTMESSVIAYQALHQQWFAPGSETRGRSDGKTNQALSAPGIDARNEGCPAYDMPDSAPGRYKAQGPTHIRTIRVFEALKLSEEALL